MRNLTAPKQYTDPNNRTTFDAGTEGLVLYTPAGEPVRLHVGSDGFLYINDQPFGVQGMPPALHAAMHATGGGDPVTPAAIGAVPASRLADSPKAAGVPVLDGNGHLPAEMIAGRVTPAVHAASHAKGGADAITPTSIGAVASNDTRLSDARTPTSHAVSHAVNGSDAITPESIGAVNANDFRLSDSRVPKTHRATHNKNGSDPISWFDVGSVDAEMFTVRERIPYGYPQLNDSGHIDINLLPTSTSLPGNHASSHAADGSDPVTPIIINAADRQHKHGNADITGLDASKVTSGVLDLARIPQGALERLALATDAAAMLALTTADVQLGDTVKRLDTGVMYRVVDEAALGTMSAFMEYSAGRAAAVLWSGVEGKPSAFTPSTHAASHATGGADQITPEGIGAASLSQLTIAVKAVNDSAVHNTGNEAISGQKVFYADPVIFKDNPRLYLRNSALTKGVVPTEQKRTQIAFPDSDNSFMGGVDYLAQTNGSAVTRLWVYRNTAGSDFASMELVYPASGGPYATCPTPPVNATGNQIATAGWVLARLAALESRVVLSTNIATISGSTLPDGVGTIQFTEKS